MQKGDVGTWTIVVSMEVVKRFGLEAHFEDRVNGFADGLNKGLEIKEDSE